MNLRLIISLLFLLGGAAIFCHGVNISHHSKELEAVITTMMECHHLPGLAVSVVQGGSVWAKGFGEAVIGNVPFSPDTKVPIGTLANIFTTIVLDRVMAQKNYKVYPQHWIRWYTPVNHILRNIGLSDPFLTEKLTLEDLAAGRTGLSPLSILWKAEALPDTLTRSDLASQFHKIPKLADSFPYRGDFASNHFDHGLLGRATEVLGSGKWKQLIQDKLLKVLQMNDTGFLGDPQTSITAERRFAFPYEYCPDCPSFFRTRYTMDTPLSKYSLPVVYPGNGMFTTVKDMAKLLNTFLRDWRPPHLGMIIRSVLTTRKTFVNPDHPWVVNLKKPKNPANYKTFSYGKGWFLAQYNGYDVAWNVGKLHSYLTFTAMVRDLDLAMTFFANSAGNDTFSPLLMSYIVDLAAGEPRWFNTSSVCSFHGESRPDLTPVPSVMPLTNTTAIEDATEVAGTYRDPLFGEVTVTQKGQTLHATYGRFTGDLSKTTQFKQPDFKFNPAGMGSELLIRFREKPDGQKMLYLCDPLGYDGYLVFSKTTNESNRK